MKTWKKNMVAAAVLVTVCAGIYVNWMYTEAQTSADLTDTLDESKILSQDMLVMNAESDLLDFENPNTVSDYFAAVRLSRQEARDSAVGLLQEAMASSDICTVPFSCVCVIYCLLSAMIIPPNSCHSKMTYFCLLYHKSKKLQLFSTHNM